MVLEQPGRGAPADRGCPQPRDATVTVGDAGAGRFSVLSFREERLSAVESLGRPADHLAARRLRAGDRLPSPQDAAAPDFQLKRFAAEPTPATT